MNTSFLRNAPKEASFFPFPASIRGQDFEAVDAANVDVVVVVFVVHTIMIIWFGGRQSFLLDVVITSYSYKLREAKNCTINNNS